MAPWKNMSIHALEQAYIRLGIDCYELLMYLSTAPVERVSAKWATENYNIITRRKQHEYYVFKDPHTWEDVLAIVENGVVLTVLTKDLQDLHLKDCIRRGDKTITKNMDGEEYEHKGF